MLIHALQSFCVLILSGYLALTSALADKIETQFPSLAPDNSSVTESITETQPASQDLVTLSRLYATTKGITSILKENDLFKQALEEGRGSAAVTNALTPVTKEEVLDALVNIICQYDTDEYTRTTTGSGFFISDRGIILTNAHVAQFLLLESTDASVKRTHCVVRTGDPATPRFNAKLLFISPTWILNNANLITEEMPQGTGEYDYALLYVDSAVDDTELPPSFPALPLETNLLSNNLAGAPVLSAGYPAEKLMREGARAELTPKIAAPIIDELYTFGSNYADIFSLSASVVGEQGASGGPVVHPEMGVIGLIVTKGDELKDGATSLRALTLSYIDRTITEETGYTLIENLQGDLPQRGKIFKEALAPFLARLLNFELEE